MTIGDDDYGLPGQTTDQERTLLETSPINASGQYGYPVRTTDGEIALMRVKPVDDTDQYAISARTTDGETALFLPDARPTIGCNSCSPNIQETFTVTIAGLTGDWSGINGAWTVTWSGGSPTSCIWSFSISGDLHIGFGWVGGGQDVWAVEADHVGAGDCSKLWSTTKATTDSCDPTSAADPYIEWTCADADCDDTDSCADSAGATCVVS